MKKHSAYPLVCFLLGMLLLSPAMAQEFLRGTIKDKRGKPIVDANLVLRQSENASISAFSISDEQGRFELKLPSGPDSIFLTITHLSYAKQQFYAKTSSPFLEVVLTPQEYELPELVVKNEPVIRRGDTLVFDVSQYREAADQNIEEVLSKIPGITIENSGRIKYNGLDISKFYIEGLDMLEGRYRIVTRNLSIDAIRDIEVIEHHQPIRALDSLVRPDNAAINIRLKSGLALTGTLRAGTGAEPALYLGRGDVFGFTKKQQFNLLFSANNIGEQQHANFQNLYIAFDEPERDLITINQLLPPFFIPKNSYLDNRELTGGFHFIKKLSTFSEFKWQGFARKDRIFTVGNRELKYTDSENEYLFNEQLNADKGFLDFDHRLVYELNAKKLFFRLDNQTTTNFADFVVKNRVNGSLFPEDLDKDLFNNTTQLTTIIRKKDKAYKVNTDIEYEITDYNLRLAPVDIFTPDFTATRFAEAIQTARQKKFDLDTYSNLFFKNRAFKGQVNLGIAYQRTALDTDIFARTDTTASTSLGRNFQNDNIVHELRPYLNQAYEFTKNRVTWNYPYP